MPLIELSKLDKRIISLGRSTKTSIPFFIPLHNWLRGHFRWYYNWHLNELANVVHWLIFITSLAVAGIAFIFIFSGGLIFGVLSLS